MGWVLMILDGSPNRVIIDKLFSEDERVTVQDVCVVNGLLHTLKEFTLVILVFVRAIDCGLLFSLGFESPNHQEWICNAKDLHKAVDCVFSLEESIGLELTMRICQEKGLKIADLDSSTFWGYVNEEKEESGGWLRFVYKSLFFVSALKSAIRLANFPAIDCCLNQLDTLLFIKGHGFYSKIRCFEVLRKKLLKNRSDGADMLKLLNNVSVLVNKDGLSYEGSDGKLEEDNRVLKRMVNFPSLDEWERKAILCEDLKLVRVCAMGFCNVKEDVRTSRTGPTRVVDLLSVRAYVRVNLFKLDNVLWYVAGKNGRSSFLHNKYIRISSQSNSPLSQLFVSSHISFLRYSFANWLHILLFSSCLLHPDFHYSFLNLLQ